MKSIKDFKEKKFNDTNSISAVGGERHKTQGGWDMVTMRNGKTVHYRTGRFDGHIGRDGW